MAKNTTGSGWTARKRVLDRRQTGALLNQPACAAILSRFPGAKIIDVRIPDADETESPDDTGPALEDDEAN